MFLDFLIKKETLNTTLPYRFWINYITQKVKLITELTFENITIFPVLPPTRYDLYIIPLIQCST